MDKALSQRLSALADPTRRAILARLALGEANVAELAQPFGISQPAVSRHLKVLEAAGLIQAGQSGQSGQSRPRRLQPHALDEVAAWLDTLRNMWSGHFDRLETFLKVDPKTDEEKIDE